ncbi:glutamate synthase domain-containing protein 3 [Rhodococcus sp. 27YEA15]|uniref:GltB/FmdC/FwdC-like GXGXG domain-containing protein n=1 Tax=Rhodococcus sp. 27YEA15 TaxID=3156259 RepID=UPI003C7C00E7
MAPVVTTTKDNSVQVTDTRPAETAVVDLRSSSVREVNELLSSPDAPKSLIVTDPQGAHALACGLDQDLSVTIDGHVGYYCAGMNQHASVTVTGNAGVGVAENMMSGTVHVEGDASQSAGATAHGGLLVIDGNAAARCGISMKGVDIVVGGNIGHMSAFMGQAGRLVVCGDAGEALGDSIYEARIYVRGTVASLGADCIAKSMRQEHLDELTELLVAAGLDHDPREFTRYGSARSLYNFHVDNASAY